MLEFKGIVVIARHNPGSGYNETVGIGDGQDIGGLSFAHLE